MHRKWMVPSGGLWRALLREGPGDSEDELFTCMYIYMHILAHISIFICHTMGIKKNTLKGSSGSLSTA